MGNRPHRDNGGAEVILRPTLSSRDFYSSGMLFVPHERKLVALERSQSPVGSSRDFYYRTP